jgi:putative colanic acid biosynthesis glycosyltransferase
MALVSVITVVRNDCDALRKTHDSLVAQLFRDFEWVIVDGASTDGTAEYALSIRTSDTQVVSEKDRGIFDAMNKGIDRAAGTFVIFLNAGDVFAGERTLLDLAPLLSGPEPIDLLYGDSLERFGSARPVYKPTRGQESVNYGMFCCHQSIFYRRAAIDDLRYDAGFRIAGDYDFTARFLKRTKNIYRIPMAVSIFDLTGASTQLEHVGRYENWRVQRDVLHLPVLQRLANQMTYLLTSGLRRFLPSVYRAFRFKPVHD